jgi:hypothetical protein
MPSRVDAPAASPRGSRIASRPRLPHE